ncbi:MAG: hypothetical protein ABEJ40_01015 [Haloarculaceae archaeon]
MNRIGTGALTVIALAAAAGCLTGVGPGTAGPAEAAGTPTVALDGSGSTAGTGTAPATAEKPTTGDVGGPTAAPASVGTMTALPGTPAGPPTCTGNETRSGFDLPSNLPSRAGGFALTASAGAVSRGEPVAFALTNVAGERRYSPTAAHYAVQRRTDDGWETVTAFRSGRHGFNATAVLHEPGSGFEWTFRASAAGFSTGKFVVCERLTPGEYRFVFAVQDPVAVRFEIRE